MSYNERVDAYISDSIIATSLTDSDLLTPNGILIPTVIEMTEPSIVTRIEHGHLCGWHTIRSTKDARP